MYNFTYLNVVKTGKVLAKITELAWKQLCILIISSSKTIAVF